jgi:hypothetical protein
MAQEEGTIHHEDHEWEAQRETFTQYYKVENKTLKDAAKCMADNHSFYATPRQWERKVKAWGLEKYATRQDRLRQIEAQGKSIHEVARGGRKNKSYDSGLLHPDDRQGQTDRNMRRFAKRELSRSRSRSRSNSFGHRSRSSSPMPIGEPGPEVLREDIYGLDFSPILQSGAMHTTGATIPMNVAAIPADQNPFATQAHVLHMQNCTTGEREEEVFLSLPEQGTEQDQDIMTDVSVLNHDQYDFSALDRRYSLETPISGRPNDIEGVSQFPPLDTSFSGQSEYVQSQTVTMEDISPTISGPHERAWAPQAAFSSQSPNPSGPYYNGQIPTSDKFNTTSPNELNTAGQFPAISEPPVVPAIDIPELVFPAASPSPASSHPEAGGLSFQEQSFSRNIPEGDQSIYADFYANVNRFSQAVMEAVRNDPFSPVQSLSDGLASQSNGCILYFVAYADVPNRSSLVRGHDCDTEQLRVVAAKSCTKYSRAGSQAETAQNNAADAQHAA